MSNCMKRRVFIKWFENTNLNIDQIIGQGIQIYNCFEEHFLMIKCLVLEDICYKTKENEQIIKRPITK